MAGTESRVNLSDRECPICFLHYAQINETQCCKATICTECFLQVRPQKEKHSVCPFCNNNKMYVAVAKRLDASEIQDREEHDQRMIELAIRARARGENVSTQQERPNDGFGSSLENDEFVNRARSRTVSDADRLSTTKNDVQLLRQLSLSSEDRLALEREMRAQHMHPLALQMEAEAEERRIANEFEYYRNHPNRSREVAMQRARLLGGTDSFRNRISRMDPENMRSGGARNRRDFDDLPDSTSLDDMVVLEAAILLSMQEEDRAKNNREHSDGITGSVESHRWFRGLSRPPAITSLDSIERSPYSRSISEEDQLAMAIALSMQDHQASASTQDANDSNSNEPLHDVARYQPESAPEPLSPQKGSGVASLPIVSEDDDDSFEEIEETRVPNGGLASAGLKYSDDDSVYLRSLDEDINVASTEASQVGAADVSGINFSVGHPPSTLGSLADSPSNHGR